MEECRAAIETISGKKLARKAAKTAGALSVGIEEEEECAAAARPRSNFNKLEAGAFSSLGNGGGSSIRSQNSGFGQKFKFSGFNGFPMTTTSKTIFVSALKQKFTGNAFKANGGSSLFPAYSSDLRSMPSSSSLPTEAPTVVSATRKSNKRRKPLSSTAYDEALNDGDEAASSRPLSDVDENSNGSAPTTTQLTNSGTAEKATTVFPTSFGSFNGMNGMANGGTMGHPLQKRKSVEVNEWLSTLFSKII